MGSGIGRRCIGRGGRRRIGRKGDIATRQAGGVTEGEEEKEARRSVG